MKHRYRFCGFILTSDRPLPELDDASCGAGEHRDAHFIDIRLDHSGAWPASAAKWFMQQDLPNGNPWSARAKTDDGYILHFHELADFTVDLSGRKVRCVARHPETSELTLRAILLDHVLPPVIALRGCYVLHAAAVLTGSGVCAFAGYSGAGKSTIAAQLTAAGNDFLTDDCLVIDERGDGFVAWAAHPSIKLRADSVAFLNPPRPGRPVADYTAKQRIRAADFGASFPLTAHPLARIYFLARDDAPITTAKPVVERLSGRAAFLKLVHHSVRLDSTDRTMLEREFDFTRRLVASVPAAQLALPNDFAALRRVHDTIAADLAVN